MSIAVALVTYNRINDLKKTLIKYEEQSVLPDEIIIVDNASTDGTTDFLEEWTRSASPIKKTVIYSSENTGGAGGFNIALDAAVKTNCDFIFISDDDALPEQNTLKFLVESPFITREDVSAVCTSVLNQGEYDTTHRSRVIRKAFRIKDIEIDRSEYSKDFFEIDRMTFVGALVKRSAIANAGLPLREYYIYNDDSEYSFRIKREGKIYCIPKSKMHHNVSRGIGKKDWVDYYGYRNYLDMIRRHFPKRYWYYAIATLYIKKCSLFSGLIWKKSKPYRRMAKSMINDSVNRSLGRNKTYPPGCTIE